MITNFIIERRDASEAYDVRKLVSSVKLTTDMDFSAGELDFDLIEVNDGFSVKNGDRVIFDWDKKNIFTGYIFKTELSKGSKYSLTAFDSMRYLKNSDSILFSVSTLGQRFERICKYLDVPYKVVGESTKKLPSVLNDNKSYFNMLKDDINQTYTATGERFFIRDNKGVVELCKYPYKSLDLVLADKSLITDYTLSRSIDNTANVVKVVQSSQQKGQKKTSTEEAKGKSIKKWGKLIYVTQASQQKMNEAQMKQLAKDTLKQKNQQETNLSITCIGNIDLQAGNSVVINVKDLKDVRIYPKRYLIKKATHHFESDYSVDLEMEM